MKYLMFIKHPEKFWTDKVPPALMQAMGQFVEQGFKSGELVDTAGLRPTKEGARVRLAGGKLRATDGPFTESKEIIGGYAMVDVATHDRALELGKQFMELHRVHWPEFEGECEIRPLADMG